MSNHFGAAASVYWTLRVVGGRKPEQGTSAKHISEIRTSPVSPIWPRSLILFFPPLRASSAFALLWRLSRDEICCLKKTI